MAQESGSAMMEEVFRNIRKTAEANMKMQQELFQQWSSIWPMPTPQSVWVEKLRDFQKQWAHTISDLASKHRAVVDKQYQAAVESLDAALRLTEATNPEEYRRRIEQLFRKALDCVREVSETQVKEFQDAVSKWTELATKART